MSPTLKDLETCLPCTLSHAKLCRGLIHLALFPLPTNNIIAVVSDVQKQKIGIGMTLATQQHMLASSAQTTISECMNAQSLLISQKEEVTRRERCICFVVHTGCSMLVCSQSPQGFKGLHGNPSPHKLCKVAATSSLGFSAIFLGSLTVVNTGEQHYKALWRLSLWFWSEDGYNTPINWPLISILMVRLITILKAFIIVVLTSSPASFCWYRSSALRL